MEVHATEDAETTEKRRKQHREHGKEVHATEDAQAKKGEENKTWLDKARGIDNQIKIGKKN